MNDNIFGTAPSQRPKIIAFLVVCLLLQLVLGGHVSLFGATPNFLMPLVFLLAVSNGGRLATVAGFVLGLLFDLVGNGPVGLSALLGCLFGYVAALWCSQAGSMGVAETLARFAALALAYNAFYFTLLLLMGGSVEIGLAAIGRILSSTALDSAVAWAVFAVDALLRKHTDNGVQLGR